MPNLEVERRIDLRVVELHEHIVAGDAEMRRAKRNESGNGRNCARG